MTAVHSNLIGREVTLNSGKFITFTELLSGINRYVVRASDGNTYSISINGTIRDDDEMEVGFTPM